MVCPKCGGDVWDNQPKKADGSMKPNAPDFACKDKEGCGWKQWPERKPKSAPRASAVVRGPKWTWPQLQTVYRRCFLLAEKRLVEASRAGPKLGFTMADVLAATATIFIAASRDGVQDEAQVPEPQPLDERPRQLTPADDEEIPF